MNPRARNDHSHDVNSLYVVPVRWSGPWEGRIVGGATDVVRRGALHPVAILTDPPSPPLSHALCACMHVPIVLLFPVHK